MKSRKTRILLADDHFVVRMGIASIISFEKDMTVVGEADTGAEAVRRALELRPDVVVMDLMMPEMDGGGAAAEILRELPQTKIIILTSFTGAPELRRAIEAGVVAVLDKDASQGAIVSSIRDAMAGKITIRDELRENLKQPTTLLTPRQVEVLRLVAKGFTNKEIAKILSVGSESVKDRVAGILARLNASSRSEAVAIAMSERIIDP